MELSGDLDTRVRCTLCGGEFSPRELLRAADAGYPNLQVLLARTPCCGSREELWARTGLVSRGYIYAAGQAHFAEMERYQAPGLQVDYAESQVTLRLGGEAWRIER